MWMLVFYSLKKILKNNFLLNLFLTVLLNVSIVFSLFLSSAYSAQLQNKQPLNTLTQSNLNWVSSLFTQNKPNNVLDTNNNQPLSIEEAFKTKVFYQNNRFYLSFDIAPKYYLYQEKIKIVLNTHPISASTYSPDSINSFDKASKELYDSSMIESIPISFPKAISHYDDTFKKAMLIYRNQLLIPLPFKINTSIQSKSFNFPISLIVYSQGCADIGICYPPRIQSVELINSQKDAIITELKQDPFKQVLKSLNPAASNSTLNDLSIKDSSPLRDFNNLDTNTNYTNQVIPEQTQLINTDNIDTINQNNNLADFNINNTYKSVNSDNSTVNTLSHVNIFKNIMPVNATMGEWIQIQPIGLWVLTCFVLGILLAFTPCTLPMLPIISAMVLNNTGDSAVTTLHALKRSAMYVLGMCVAYTVLGVLAGLIGTGLSGFLQQPSVLIGFAILMVLMAGLQFDWYSLRLPAFLQSRLSTPASNQPFVSKPLYFRLFIMGMLSAGIVSPCLTPPLAGILLFISQTKDVLNGGLALFSLSLGMGLPLLLITIGGSTVLPKSGVWMKQINYFFGILLLTVALWMIQSLIPVIVFNLAFIGILLLFAEFLGVFHSLKEHSTRFARLLKAFGLCIVLWAFAILIGIATGVQVNITQPLNHVSIGFIPNTLNVNQPNAMFETVSSTQLIGMLNQANKQLEGIKNTQSNKLPYIVDIYADWCRACIEFEEQTLTDSTVKQALQSFKRVRIDVTKYTLDDQIFMKKLGIFGPPAVVFYSPNGQFLGKNTVLIGFKNADQFLKHIQFIQSILMNTNKY